MHARLSSIFASTLLRCIAMLCLAVLTVGCSARPTTAPSATTLQVPPTATATAPIANVAIAPVQQTTVEPIAVPWAWKTFQGEEYDLGSVVLRSTLRDPLLRDRVLSFLPLMMDHYRTALVPLAAPRDAPLFFIFGTRNEWMAYTRLRIPNEAATYEKIGRGGYTIEGESVLYDLGRFDTFTIVAHEGWHAFTQSNFEQPLPVWLEEGIACFMEGSRRTRGEGKVEFMPWRNFERYSELRDAHARKRLIPLESLLADYPQSFLEDGRSALLTYYAQVWALVHFLNEGMDGKYHAGLVRILAHARDGKIAETLWSSRRSGIAGERRMMLARQLGPAVLREYFNEDVAQLTREYDAYVQDLCTKGSWERVFRGDRPSQGTSAR
ncbi:MAG: DUF1570 domain-containing protein [Phycisphaerales bacterium]|nr:DUF1570 domain-containing protein [Phycisphaerales bacterium]